MKIVDTIKMDLLTQMAEERGVTELVFTREDEHGDLIPLAIDGMCMANEKRGILNVVLKEEE